MSDEKIININKHDKFDPVVKGLDFSDLTNDSDSGQWDPEINAFLDNSTLKGLFYSEDWVFLLVDLLADTVSQQDLKVFKRTQEGKEETFEEDPDHPVNTLLEMPNEFQEYSSWMYNYVVEQVLMGNTINWRARGRNQLIILPADGVQLTFDNKNKLNTYRFVAADINNQIGSAMDFKVKEIWHQKKPNPNSYLWGLSPFIPNRKSILFHRYTQDYLNAFYLKGATPGLALKMEKNVDEKNALRFLRSFEMSHTGRRNMRRTLVLPKGVDVEVLSNSFGDQKLIEMINSNREMIINILKVPKHALSLAETGSLGSEEHKQALKFFYQVAILPLQEKISQFLTRQFQRDGDLAEDEFLMFDNSDVEVLKDDLLKKAELAERLKSTWTLNEIRQELFKKEAIAGGDELPGKPQTQGGFNIPFQMTTQPVETKAAVLEAPEIGEDTKAFATKVNKMVFEKYGLHIDLFRKQRQVALSKENLVLNFWLKTFEKWAKEGVKIAKRELEKQPTIKADSDKPSSVPARRRLKKIIEREYSKQENDWLTFAFDEFSSVMDDAYDVQLTPVFDGDNGTELEALKQRDQEKRREILQARALNSFKNISKTTSEKIMSTITKGVEEKRTIGQIGADIAENFKQIAKSRGQTIARTEILTAVSLGKAAALNNAVEVIPDLKKVWINLGDDRVRGNPSGKYADSKADHWELQGVTVDPDDPFPNGLMYPRDTDGDANETINCRCDYIIIPAEDIEALQP